MIEMPSPIRQIDACLKSLKEEIEAKKKEIAELEARRQKLLSLPEICPTCKGTGEERYTDAAGSGDWRECRTCKGLGRVGPWKCKNCGRIIGTDMIWLRRQQYPNCPYCGSRLEA